MPATPAPRAQPWPAATLAQLAGARILLVEDNDFNQIVATELLAETGAAVEVTANGHGRRDRWL